MAYSILFVHTYYFILCTFRFPDDTMMPSACAWSMVQRPEQLFLLIMVLRLRYSAAGWPGLWPLRPFLDFVATRAPTFTLGVYWGIGCFETSASRSLSQLQAVGLQYDPFHHPSQVWPHIRHWGPLTLFFKASIPNYLTGEYPDD